MHILILNHNVKEVGTYIRCFNFAKHLVRLGHHVSIMTSAPRYMLLPKREYQDGVEILTMPDIIGRRYRNGGLGLLDTLQRCLVMTTKTIDVVQSFDHRPAVLYPAMFGKYGLNLPLVAEWTDLHGTGGSLSNRSPVLQQLIGPYENFTERKSKFMAAKLIVISHGLKQRALELGIPAGKIVRIPGGANIDGILPLPKAEARNAFQLPVDKKIIGYTAGTQYDTHLLIDTINQVQDQRPDTLFFTTGNRFTQANYAKIHHPDRLIQFGFLPAGKYRRVLPCADLFIFPFTNRPLNIGRWPNKVGDYMAAGRPTISNPTGDMVELFQTHRIGLLAEEIPEKFAACILALLDNDDLCAQLGHEARQVAEKYYDWSILTKKLEGVYKEVRGVHADQMPRPKTTAIR